jgi:hypothetical protein
LGLDFRIKPENDTVAIENDIKAPEDDTVIGCWVGCSGMDVLTHFSFAILVSSLLAKEGFNRIWIPYGLV